jgi:hypothetical protein
MINFRFDLSIYMENLSKSIQRLINGVIIGFVDLFYVTLAQIFRILAVFLVKDDLLLLPVTVVCSYWSYRNF